MNAKLELTKDEARAIIWDDYDGDIEVIEDDLIDTTRWSEVHNIIIKKDGRFYQDSYSVGATEMQDEEPYEYSEPNFTEVFPVEKTVIVYKAVKS